MTETAFRIYPGAMVEEPDQHASKGSDFSSVDSVLEAMRERGGRATSSRRILLEILFEDDHHRSAEELAEAVQSRSPDVHLSTIYRNLDDLESIGVISHTHLGHGPVMYQLASLAHPHFICRSCGKRIGAPEEIFLGLAAEAKRKLGFEIDPSHFAISGLCIDCS